MQCVESRALDRALEVGYMKEFEQLSAFLVTVVFVLPFFTSQVSANQRDLSMDNTTTQGQHNSFWALRFIMYCLTLNGVFLFPLYKFEQFIFDIMIEDDH